MLCHGFSDAMVRFRSELGSFRSRRHPPDSLLPFLHDLGRLQFWQAFKPQACCFCFSVSKLPGLYYLVGLPVNSRHDSYRVLDCYSFARSIGKSHKEVNASLLSSVCSFFCKPLGTGDSEVRAGREGQDHVPPDLQQFHRVDLQMPLWVPPPNTGSGRS